MASSTEFVDVLCMSCSDDKCDFKATKKQRRAPGDNDVTIDMRFCGVCHSDLSVAAGHLKGLDKVQYDCVPGHELAGVVSAVGKSVTKFKLGDKIGVGCMVDSCISCAGCKAGKEQKCSKQTPTYNGADKNGNAAVWPPKSKTIGGYTNIMVVHENFGILIPESYPLESAGPVMCAGITMYDPMKALKVKAGSRVGIVGLGGLGVMGVKIAKAMGAHVTVISRGPQKEALAKKNGADSYVDSKIGMKAAAGTLDVIINTVPVYHDYVAYQVLLDKKSTIGRQVLLGLHEGLIACFAVSAVTFNKSRLMGSGIGGIANTQEVVDLCAKHNIHPALKVVPCSDLNKIYGMLDSNNDDGLRYVLDIKNTLKEDTVCTESAPALKHHAGVKLSGILSELMSILFFFKWY
jgi:uncharacterized zinc-type alcohol dehydrogenase-like protein